MGKGAGAGGASWRARRTAVRLLVALVDAAGVRRVPPPPRDVPLERVVLRLRVLDAELGRLGTCDARTPAIYARMLAARLAYDGLLGEACEVLGLEPPGPPPLDGIHRLEVEAGLTAAGLRW